MLRRRRKEQFFFRREVVPHLTLEQLRRLRFKRSCLRGGFVAQFTFQQAKTLVSYLDALGIGQCYASPILAARPGSVHGYDIIDHNSLNPEIGSEADFRALAAELKARGMGLLLDVVPNHMGVG